MLRGNKKNVKISSCTLFKMKMVVRMISRNITITHHYTPCGGGHGVGGWEIVMFAEIILTTIFIFNSLHEL
jgi:hypothetical protein